MTCIKAQSMITPFINNKLGIKEMEEFLEHVEVCPDCMEELEYYYTLLTAMRQLDEDKNLSIDYKLELAAKIKKAQDKIVHVKYTYYRKITILVIFMLALAFLLGIRYAEEIRENTATAPGKNIIRMFRDERAVYVNMKLEEYCREQGIDKILVPDFNSTTNMK